MLYDSIGKGYNAVRRLDGKKIAYQVYEGGTRTIWVEGSTSFGVRTVRLTARPLAPIELDRNPAALY